MAITKELLDILACPVCKGEVRLHESRDGLVCPACMLLYPVWEGIPVMLVDEAEKIEGL
ncbi:Trm112 family protein [Geobacter sp.]|uniref:Trm112 family protein n=1 Tax=Geobacter sp. TaxID=46610 RepID=UPI00260F1D58|nr:Trm112 family protein [Geobacter sp.]